MSKLSVFNFITLNGFYKGANGDITWHKHGAEEGEFAAKNASAGNTLLFGRATYEMMAGFWPTQNAIDNMPGVAAGMNSSEKIVFSKTLKKADWNNTTLIKDNIVEEIKKRKQSGGKDMTILGSGSIVTLFADHGLIDEYQLMIDPVAIAAGTPIFNGLKHSLDLKLISTRTFSSGVILLIYHPV